MGLLFNLKQNITNEKVSNAIVEEYKQAVATVLLNWMNNRPMHHEDYPSNFREMFKLKEGDFGIYKAAMISQGYLIVSDNKYKATAKGEQLLARNKLYLDYEENEPDISILEFILAARLTHSENPTYEEVVQRYKEGLPEYLE